MTEILLIRHGETAWNAEKRMQGHLDIPLNAEGARQAAALGQALLNEPLDAIICSDLQRAMQTAHAIAAPRGMEVKIEPGLRERCFGAFEGLLYADIGAHYPEAYAAWQAREIDARYPQGVHVAETLREFFERAVGTITRLVSATHHRKLALVTHGGVLECAYRAAQGAHILRPRDFDVLNASINRLAWDGKSFRIIQWADIAHLTASALDEVER
jgi:probable phosphoglycerate mutase